MARLGPLRIVIWNVEWAAAGGRKGRTLRERIWDLAPDVVCICEGQEDWAPSDGFLLFPDRPYSPKAKPRYRKVMLWSRRPWHQADRVGAPGLPPGRFLSATTDTPLGPVGFVGVCVPCEMANVVYGTGTSRNWEDHLRFLGGLAPILADDFRASRTVVLGDFNQRIPATRGGYKTLCLLRWVPGSGSRPLACCPVSRLRTSTTSRTLTICTSPDYADC